MLLSTSRQTDSHQNNSFMRGCPVNFKSIGKAVREIFLPKTRSGKPPFLNSKDLKTSTFYEIFIHSFLTDYLLFYIVEYGGGGR